MSDDHEENIIPDQEAIEPGSPKNEHELQSSPNETINSDTGANAPNVSSPPSKPFFSFPSQSSTLSDSRSICTCKRDSLEITIHEEPDPYALMAYSPITFPLTIEKINKVRQRAQDAEAAFEIANSGQFKPNLSNLNNVYHAFSNHPTNSQGPNSTPEPKYFNFSDQLSSAKLNELRRRAASPFISRTYTEEELDLMASSSSTSPIYISCDQGIPLSLLGRAISVPSKRIIDEYNASMATNSATTDHLSDQPSTSQSNRPTSTFIPRNTDTDHEDPHASSMSYVAPKPPYYSKVSTKRVTKPTCTYIPPNLNTNTDPFDFDSSSSSSINITPESEPEPDPELESLITKRKKIRSFEEAFRQSPIDPMQPSTSSGLTYPDERPNKQTRIETDSLFPADFFDQFKILNGPEDAQEAEATAASVASGSHSILRPQFSIEPIVMQRLGAMAEKVFAATAIDTSPERELPPYFDRIQATTRKAYESMARESMHKFIQSRDNVKEDNINSILSDKLLCLVFDFLHLEDLFSARSVCPRWTRIYAKVCRHKESLSITSAEVNEILEDPDWLPECWPIQKKKLKRKKLIDHNVGDFRVRKGRYRRYSGSTDESDMSEDSSHPDDRFVDAPSSGSNSPNRLMDAWFLEDDDEGGLEGGERNRWDQDLIQRILREIPRLANDDDDSDSERSIFSGGSDDEDQQQQQQNGNNNADGNDRRELLNDSDSSDSFDSEYEERYMRKMFAKMAKKRQEAKMATMYSFKSYLFKFPKLRSLTLWGVYSLNNHNLTRMLTDWSGLVKLELNISHNKNVYLYEIVPFINRLKSLRTLSLVFTTLGSRAIYQPMTCLAQLKEFNLEFEEFSPSISHFELNRMLMRLSATKLRKLGLGFLANRFQTRQFRKYAKSLQTFAHRNPHLFSKITSLSIPRARITDQFMKFIISGSLVKSLIALELGLTYEHLAQITCFHKLRYLAIHRRSNMQLECCTRTHPSWLSSVSFEQDRLAHELSHANHFEQIVLHKLTPMSRVLHLTLSADGKEELSESVISYLFPLAKVDRFVYFERNQTNTQFSSAVVGYMDRFDEFIGNANV